MQRKVLFHGIGSVGNRSFIYTGQNKSATVLLTQLWPIHNFFSSPTQKPFHSVHFLAFIIIYFLMVSICFIFKLPATITKIQNPKLCFSQIHPSFRYCTSLNCKLRERRAVSGRKDPSPCKWRLRKADPTETNRAPPLLPSPSSPISGKVSFNLLISLVEPFS